mmetsp:Transcript_32871/g.48210  ORF Transcript_32871/g.48210 Transcript_32871/m.48210 type:complete len:330 (+) Transcript_32871:23-1012(+)|eukprot:CAMPEP_0195509142 /NCGR_PEP_ID=MMETSP0794_2-20130614/2168_1 /TAXON_ID=515487 /ORGANISM="Stephanopyxis turris, Strain CCMP 815" /LENGTH=329 /DNA_ID=CAMNT_0040636297 /DNA_START=22 /DNA_END=1011 /DNA_ORIENTATION=+
MNQDSTNDSNQNLNVSGENSITGNGENANMPIASIGQINPDCDPSTNQCISIPSNQCIQFEYDCVYGDSPAPLPANTPRPDLQDLVRELAAEFVGTLLLVLVVVASGIQAENLSSDVGVQLLINSVATVGGLYGLITIFGPVSGAHFNPVVSLVDVFFQDMPFRRFGLYSLFQTMGGIVGAVLANIQYAIPTRTSTNDRYGYELWISEVIATSTLILAIHGCIRTGKESSVPSVVSLWVGGGYFFTSSSIFANPAVTVGRIFTDSFAGIDPLSAGVYIGFQLIGAMVGFFMVRLFYPRHPQPLNSGDNLYRRACILDLETFYKKEGYGK